MLSSTWTFSVEVGFLKPIDNFLGAQQDHVIIFLLLFFYNGFFASFGVRVIVKFRRRMCTVFFSEYPI